MNIAEPPVSRHRRRRHVSVIVLGIALLLAAACGSDATSSATHRGSTAATTAVPLPTASPQPTIPLTSPTPLTTTASDAPTTTAHIDARPTALLDEHIDARPTALLDEHIDARPTALLDELVEVDGATVHVRCAGRGAATVVLISGFEAGSATWTAVEPTISARTRVCSYDRPGTGTSGPAGAIATFATQADDLRDLLTAVGEPGPFVVVGHSFGGGQAVTFASTYPDEVIGLVLVDASPTDWPEALCAVDDDGSDAATIVHGLCAGWSDPTSNAEHLDVVAAFAEVAAVTSLGSLPTAVISAVDRQLPAGLATDEMERLADAWDHGQRRWSQLSTRSHLVSVEDSSHDIQLDHPDVVVGQIVRLLP